jgi:Tol biopolymer transport system component
MGRVRVVGLALLAIAGLPGLAEAAPVTVEERIVVTTYGLSGSSERPRGAPYSPPFDIAAIDLDGNVDNLTSDNPAEDWYAAVSGDGSRIAYIRRSAEDPTGGEYDIWVMGADGSTKVPVTSDGGMATEHFPNFSPDSTWIAFSRHPEDGSTPGRGPWAVFSDGSQVPLAAKLPGAVRPEISPSGTRMSTLMEGDIWLSDLDGSSAINLTGPLFAENDEELWHNVDPDWAPDGNSIIFERRGGPILLPGEAPQDPSADIYRVNVDGSGLELLTPGERVGFAPSYSPDGLRIAFNGPGAAPSAPMGDIWVMNQDGSNPRNLTNSRTPESWPDWGHLVIPRPGSGALGDCEDPTSTLSGTAAKDILPGTRRGDVIAGEGGDDQLVGGGGEDVLCAGDPGTSDSDVLDGGRRKDHLDGGSGADVLRGGPGRDLLIGGPGDDSCKGGPGKDRVKSC